MKVKHQNKSSILRSLLTEHDPNLESNPYLHSLKQFKENLNLIFNSLPQGITITDDKGYIIETNREAAKLLGIPKRKHHGRYIGGKEWNIIRPDGSKMPDSEFPSVKALKTGKRVDNVVMGIVKKKNQITWINVTAAPLNISGYGVIVAYGDITRQKIIEEMFKVVVDSSPLAIYLAEGIEQKAEYLNPRFTELFGYTIEDVPTAGHWFLLAYPDRNYREGLVKEWKRRVIESTRTGKQIKSMEAIATCKDGSKKDILWNFISVGRKNISYGLDLSDRKRSEVRLQQNYRKIAEILDSIQDDFYVLDKNWNFVFASKKFTSRINKEPKDFVGNNLWRMFPKHLGTVYEKNLREAMEKRETRRFEVAGKYTNAWYKMTVFPSEEGVTVLGSDITGQKDLERKKDEFISIASHELKTPITTIKGFAQIIAQRLEKSGDLQNYHLMERMEGQIERLTNLVSEFLDVTKIQAGKLPLKEAYFNLNELVREIIHDLTLTANTGHAIIVKGRICNEIYADKFRISQVITNILSNAVKYSPSSSNIIVSLKSDSKEIIVSIRDFGIGIAPKEQSMVFERFFQSRITREKEGRLTSLGLGLYISSEIIKQHGGQIRVISKEGKGSTFIFTLPKENLK